MQTIPRDDARPCSQGANGWQFKANNTRLELCGTACALVKGNPAGKVAINVGCATVGPDGGRYGEDGGSPGPSDGGSACIREGAACQPGAGAACCFGLACELASGPSPVCRNQIN